MCARQHEADAYYITSGFGREFHNSASVEQKTEERFLQARTFGLSLWIHNLSIERKYHFHKSD